MAKILLVEDDNNLREIYQARLTAEGYDITAAQDGEEALVVAKKVHPDLIISDVMMPRISGFEMLDILRNTDELKHTKIIMLTALGQAEDQARADNLGADKYLVKSQVTLEDIVNSAKELLAGAVAAPAADATATPAPVSTGTSETATPAVAPTPEPPQIDPAIEPELTPPAPPASEPVPTEPATPVDPVTPEPAADEITPATQVDSPSPAAVATVTAPPATEEADTPTPAASVTPVDVVEAPEETPTATAEPSTAPSLATPEATTDAPDPSASTDVTEAASPNEPTSSPEPKTEAQSLEAEEAAIQAQISDFASQEPSVATPSGIGEPTASTAPAPTVVAPETVLPDTATTPQSPDQDDDEKADDAIMANAVDQLTSNVIAPDPVADDGAPTITASSSGTVPMPDPSVPATETSNEQVPIAHKKVISPISDAGAKPSLDELLAKEAANEPDTTIGTPVVNGTPQTQEPPAVTPTDPEKKPFDPGVAL